MQETTVDDPVVHVRFSCVNFRWAWLLCVIVRFESIIDLMPFIGKIIDAG
jgi:hypothetical protein